MNYENSQLNTLDYIMEKFNFSDEEYEKLIRIRKSNIQSISFTTNGGFDPESKEFHPDERDTCYKIRIVYFNNHDKLSYLFLKTLS